MIWIKPLEVAYLTKFSISSLAGISAIMGALADYVQQAEKSCACSIGAI
ncbi:MAG: hypothetical protein FWF81_13375 [Defluviitaleaceae bacterium]|nr:hypothetical protein [Defluviitaleaceae bacterium]